MFRYESIDWTTGTASDGANGLGGTVARAGFNSGAGGATIELPQSGNQQAILDLDQNLPSCGMASGRPGVYIFEIQIGRFSPIDESENIMITETTGKVNVTLEQIVGYIAQNGAKQAALGVLTDSSEIKRINLEAAKSRIADTDLVVEMQNLSKARILSEIGFLAVKQSMDSQKAILQIIDNLRIYILRQSGIYCSRRILGFLKVPPLLESVVFSAPRELRKRGQKLIPAVMRLVKLELEISARVCGF